MSKEASNYSWIHGSWIDLHAMSQLCKTRLVDLRTKHAWHFNDLCSYVYMHIATNKQHTEFFNNTFPSILVTPFRHASKHKCTCSLKGSIRRITIECLQIECCKVECLNTSSMQVVNESTTNLNS